MIYVYHGLLFIAVVVVVFSACVGLVKIMRRSKLNAMLEGGLHFLSRNSPLSQWFVFTSCIGSGSPHPTH
jgi:hypothetical protein